MKPLTLILILFALKAGAQTDTAKKIDTAGITYCGHPMMIKSNLDTNVYSIFRFPSPKRDTVPVIAYCHIKGTRFKWVKAFAVTNKYGGYLNIANGYKMYERYLDKKKRPMKLKVVYAIIE